VPERATCPGFSRRIADVQEQRLCCVLLVVVGAKACQNAGMRPVLLVGGAPRVQIDAVRFMSVHATGRTAIHLAEALRAASCPAELLLSCDAQQDVQQGSVAGRYVDRAQLERALQDWIARHAHGVVVMSAAINDYQLATVALVDHGTVTPIGPDRKAPSGSQEMVIHLTPASKVIDQVRGWGLKGPLIAFKYEDRATVLASAQSLRRRVGAAVVVANSLCQTVQALVDETGIIQAADRSQVLDMLRRRILTLAADESVGG
jgi:phosphopantothenoylcysteine synthetase/decarboxylase